MAEEPEDLEDVPPTKSIWRELFEISQSAARGAPRWSQPLLLPLTALLLALAILVLLLPYLLLSVVRRRRPRPFDIFRTEVEGAWASESPAAAMAIVRDVHNKVDILLSRGRMWRLRIAPYGRLSFWDAYQICWYRYHLEMQVGNYDGAIEACDVFMRPAEKRGGAADLELWLVLKAKAIRARDGRAAALEYVMRHRDPAREAPKIDKYVSELKGEPGP